MRRASGPADPHTRAVHAYGLARGGSRPACGARPSVCSLQAVLRAWAGRCGCGVCHGQGTVGAPVGSRGDEAGGLDVDCAAERIAVDAIARGEVEDWSRAHRRCPRGSPCGGSDVGAAQRRSPARALVLPAASRPPSSRGSAWDLLLAGGRRQAHPPDQLPWIRAGVQGGRRSRCGTGPRAWRRAA